MREPTWISTCAFHLVLVSFTRSVPTHAVFKDSQLYEGSRCQLRDNGGEGVCTKVENCPEALRQVELGNYRHVSRCGFFRFEEIVCCPTSVSKPGDRKRPADVACEMYKKTASQLTTEPTFSIVVFNGVLAKAREYPSMAALGYVASDNEEGAIRGRKYVCGGTLISQKHVVTAAHCVNNIQGFVPVEVLLGTIDITKPNAATMQRIPVSRIIEHPRHRRSYNYHDVAILELENSILFSADVQPSCLMTKSPTSLPETEKSHLNVLGWGAIDLDGTTSTSLLKAVGLKFVEINECSRSYRNLQNQLPNGLDEGMVCAVDANSTRKADTCWGDSGGPLLLSAEKFAPLVGITSFGQACGGTTPGVYASIYKYLSWIEDQVWPELN